MTRLTDEQIDTIAAYAESGGDTELLALVAECRANRRVVEAARKTGNAVRSGASPFTELAKLLIAIEVHDRVTGATP